MLYVLRSRGGVPVRHAGPRQVTASLCLVVLEGKACIWVHSFRRLSALLQRLQTYTQNKLHNNIQRTLVILVLIAGVLGLWQPALLFSAAGRVSNCVPAGAMKWNAIGQRRQQCDGDV